jgi:hypothetical protein
MEKRKMLKRLLRNRKGTAEVIGSVLFIVILLFFFTNVYLWHDAATQQVNNLYVNKMNAGMEVSFDDENHLVIIPKGSDVKLSRLWIITSDNHVYADLQTLPIQVRVNNPITIIFDQYSPNPSSGVSVAADLQDSSHIIVRCPFPGGSVKCAVLNTLGIVSATS